MTHEPQQPVEPEWVAPAEADALATGPDPAAGRRVSQRGAAGAMALVLAGAAGGAGIAHAAWHPTTTTASVAPSSATGPGSGQGMLPGLPGGGQAQPVDPFGGSGLGGSSGGGADTTGDGPTDAATIASKVDPAVVDINTTIGYHNAQAAGTGMVLTSTGEILTNNHVISGATSIRVTDVGNGRTYQATVVGYDRSSDVAVLQLQGASGLATISTSSTAAQPGAGVVGIGNAGGTGGTPSYAGGVITAVGQSITASDSGDGTSEQLTGLLATDAGIVAGDSGGPLVDAQGEVVGMDTAASAGFSFSQSSKAFAVPISHALEVAQQIESGHSSSTVHIGSTAMLGVGIRSGGSSEGSSGGFGSGSGSGQPGAVVSQVESGSAASAAGLAVGDTIIGFAGQTVSSGSDLSRLVTQATPGQSVTVTYLDASGRQHTTTAHLTAGPPQ